MQKVETRLQEVRRKAEVVRATESVQRVQSEIAHRYSGANSHLQSAVESLERIERLQQERAAQFEAAEDLSREQHGQGLDQRLHQAGILPGQKTSTPDAVLARLQGEGKD